MEVKSTEERILPATRRPDGTMRKPVRIRAGYVAQEEVAIYQSKGALMKKEALLVPPGYDPETDLKKPKTKAAKKNEKRKEKKHQARLASGTAESEANDAEVESVAEQLNALQVSNGEKPEEIPNETKTEEKPQDASKSKSDIEKRIRALKKKIRLANESQNEASSSEKLAKVQAWEKELKELELKIS